MQRDNTDLSQQEKAIRIMIQHKDKNKWFYAWEFINDNGVFIGHRGPARISELAIWYPEMIESKKEGRYKIFRFRFENITNMFEALPNDLRWFVRAELSRNGLETKVITRETIYIT